MLKVRCRQKGGKGSEVWKWLGDNKQVVAREHQAADFESREAATKAATEMRVAYPLWNFEVFPHKQETE